jgi:hypothetical protein
MLGILWTMGYIPSNTVKQYICVCSTWASKPVELAKSPRKRLEKYRHCVKQPKTFRFMDRLNRVSKKNVFLWAFVYLFLWEIGGFVLFDLHCFCIQESELCKWMPTVDDRSPIIFRSHCAVTVQGWRSRLLYCYHSRRSETYFWVLFILHFCGVLHILKSNKIPRLPFTLRQFMKVIFMHTAVLHITNLSIRIGVCYKAFRDT